MANDYIYVLLSEVHKLNSKLIDSPTTKLEFLEGEASSKSRIKAMRKNGDE